MLNTKDNLITITTIWACWSILREEHELSSFGFNSGYNIVIRIIGFIESIVVIVFSITLILNPTFERIMIHFILLGIELLTSSLYPIINKLTLKETKNNEISD